jgi:hypothetical protein
MDDGWTELLWDYTQYLMSVAALGLFITAMAIIREFSSGRAR